MGKIVREASQCAVAYVEDSFGRRIVVAQKPNGESWHATSATSIG